MKQAAGWPLWIVRAERKLHVHFLGNARSWKHFVIGVATIAECTAFRPKSEYPQRFLKKLESVLCDRDVVEQIVIMFGPESLGRQEMTAVIDKFLFFGDQKGEIGLDHSAHGFEVLRKLEQKMSGWISGLISRIAGFSRSERASIVSKMLH